MKKKMSRRETRLIETDDFPVDFLSKLALRESWRKEIHRPVYHVHKWWAKRLGSVFRGILLGCVSPSDAELRDEFYREHTFSKVVFDPFMGSGTTIGEAHKLGMAALGRDINPVAVNAVRTALGPLNARKLRDAFDVVSMTAGVRLRELYRSLDSNGRPCDVLYFFWVMQAPCPACATSVDLFSSYIFAKNAYPDRKPEVQILCPSCGDVFCGSTRNEEAHCPTCNHAFNSQVGPVTGSKARCQSCGNRFTVLDAIRDSSSRPNYRLYAKLVLTSGDQKQYLRATNADVASYDRCSTDLSMALQSGDIAVPDAPLTYGHNTRQAMNYGFVNWKDFFNDRQLLALGTLHREILALPEEDCREALLTLFSGVLEFNNLFASYKGEGTGAVRHMFSHHILKPERTPIEASPWGTPKSSGAFSNMFRTRLLRAVQYRDAPTEVNGDSGPGRVCSPAFTGRVSDNWPIRGDMSSREIYLSCGDSSKTDLPNASVDLVVTDPPFFDNVHYSELADFFYAWTPRKNLPSSMPLTTRHRGEVQDADPNRFADKLRAVFTECCRILKDDGIMVFSYHHSRDDGWLSLAKAVFGAGFWVVNAQPLKAEMSVATPKSQAKEPIQLDIVLVCRKRSSMQCVAEPDSKRAIERAKRKIGKLSCAGLNLSLNDRKVVIYGQLLGSSANLEEFEKYSALVEGEAAEKVLLLPAREERPKQGLLFE